MTTRSTSYAQMAAATPRATFLRDAVAVALCGICFGAGHGYQGALGLMQTTTAGIVLGAVTVWRGSLWPAIGAHLAALRRTRSGDFTLEQAIPLDAVERDPARAAGAVIPLADVLPGLPAFMLSADGVRRAINGCELDEHDGAATQAPALGPQRLVRLIDPAGDLVGIGRASARPGSLHPAIVLM